MAVCSQCGKPLRGRSRFCTHCGAMISVAEAPEENAAPPAPPQPSPAAAKPLQLPTSQQDALDRRAIIVAAVVRGLGKSLLLGAAVLGPGILLLMRGQQLVGMLWLFAGSFGMMAWTYRKPWRLVMLTCLLPPGAALASYSVQLILFGKALPPPLLLLIVAGLGLLIGFWRARSHEVYMQDGSIFAQRTTRYLVIWIVAYAGTQVLGAMAQSVFLVAAGLLTGAYTTAMLLTVSVVLLRKRTRLLGTTAS